MGELLAESQFQPMGAASFGEALGHLRQRDLTLAVVDLALASSIAPQTNQDGWRLLETLRERRIPTLLVSGTATPEAFERAYQEMEVVQGFEKHRFDRHAFERALRELRERPEGSREGLESLTEREREVLELLVLGLGNAVIGERLFISINTVKRHLKAVFEKLGVRTRAAAVAKAARWFPSAE